MFKNLLIFSLGLLLISCTWVKVTDEGKTVSIREEGQVSDCKKVARITSKSKDKIMGVKRNQEKLKEELETLARNEALEYGGNVLVPASEIKEGKQSFFVYKCP